MQNLVEIINCYDSHVHFLATGQVASGLKLQSLKSSEEISELKIQTSHFRGSWLYGFGWNHLNWTDNSLPDIKTLDRYFPNYPVFFSRVDGHASWINTLAYNELKEKGYDFNVDPQGGIIGRDSLNQFNGVLFDQAHINALMMLPEFSNEQIKSQLLAAVHVFNQAGYTHVRDLSMSFQQALILSEIYREGAQTICIEGFITIESVNDLNSAYEEIDKINKLKNPYLKMKGLKIFTDGSLGSSTAYLSAPYLQSGLEKHPRGLFMWSEKDLTEVVKFCWSKKLEVAIHTIGDQAVDIVVDQVRKLSSQGFLGTLNLEHVQLLRSETIQKMKPLHIRCHMQPCHWLSDRTWIKSKIGPLIKNLFQWNQLIKNKINIQFGSDSPIEKPSLYNNWRAMSDLSKEGISSVSWEHFVQGHSCQDKTWCLSKTTFNEGIVSEVVFDGKKII